MRILPALSSPKGLLLLIIGIAAFLRLWGLPSVPPGLYPDEAMNGNNALEALATGDSKVFYPENNGREGLFINIQSVSIALFGNEPWALRLPSALFGILTVLGVYFLTRELFKGAKIFSSPKPPEASGYGSSEARERAEDKQVSSLGKRSGLREEEILALFAAFLLATSFWHINFSRIGFRAIMAPAFLTWGVYLLLLSLNKITIAVSKLKNSKLIRNSKLEIRNLLILPALAGVIYGLGMHSYIAYRATPLLILFIIGIYWFKNKDRQTRKRILLASFFFILASIIVFLPLGLYFFQHPDSFFGRTTQVSVFASEAPLKNLVLNTAKTLGMFNFAGDYNWRHNLAGAPQLFWPVGVMFLIGVFLAIKSFFRNSKLEIKNSSLAIMLVWLGVAMLPVIISNEGMPHALRAILMIPPVFILSGIGGIAIYNFFTRKIENIFVIKTAAIFLLFFILLNTYFTYFVRWAKNPNTADVFAKNYVEIGRQLNSLPAELPKYVIVNAGGVDVRGLPMPTQTVMFLTDTFTPEKQGKKNIHYLLPSQIEQANIPESAFTVLLK